jgi:predicted dehydrogenase
LSALVARSRWWKGDTGLLMRKIRIAVAGAGDIGRRHMTAISRDAGCQLCAVVDPQPVGQVAAAQFGVPAFTHLETMLETVRPDAVIIAAPNSLHVSLAEQCLKSGIPVLVEKPVADDVASAYALADFGDKAGVPILVGHHRRHNPIIQRAHQLLGQGLVGRIVAVSATWLVHKPDGYFNVSWRTKPGGGPVLINLIHDIDCLRFLAGEVVAVEAITSNRQRRFGVEDTAAIILAFASGALGTIILSDAAPSPWSWELTSGEATSYTYPRLKADCYLIAGSEGSLAIPSLRAWRHDGSADWQTPLRELQNDVAEADPLAAQIRHFCDVVRGTAAPLVTARDAARTLEVTLAVTQAAALRKAVDLPVRESGSHLQKNAGAATSYRADEQPAP